MQHTIKYEKITAHINFSLHSRMKIFVVACVYLGDCMHTSGLTDVSPQEMCAIYLFPSTRGHGIGP